MFNADLHIMRRDIACFPWISFHIIRSFRDVAVQYLIRCKHYFTAAYASAVFVTTSGIRLGKTRKGQLSNNGGET